MIRYEKPKPICPMCSLPGVHGNVDLCLAALKAAVAEQKKAA